MESVESKTDYLQNTHLDKMTPVVVSRSTPKDSTKTGTNSMTLISTSQKYYSKEKYRDSEIVCTQKDINVQERRRGIEECRVHCSTVEL